MLPAPMVVVILGSRLFTYSWKALPRKVELVDTKWLMRWMTATFTLISHFQS